MVHIDVNNALVRAAELDAIGAGGADPLPLHGIPVIIKEIFSIEGMPDSSGSQLLTPDLYTGEGLFVKRLLDAGCVILGKSLSTEFAFGQFNTSRAMPMNPAYQDERRATGGSSSGSAAAIAAGYCSLAIGTDTGGSVRGPAALCGVVGFKPTVGLWPTDGIFPLSARFDTPGLLTNTVEDAAYVFAVLNGTHKHDRDESAELRIGVPQEFFISNLDPEVATAFAAAQKNIISAGHVLVPLEFPAMEPVEHYFSSVLPRELLDTLGRTRVEHNLEKLDSLTRRRLESVLHEADNLELGEQLNRLTAATDAILADAAVDSWIAPTVPCTAPLQSELMDTDALVRWQAWASRNTRCINALGMTAITLPLPTRQPVGLQIAARGGAEALLLGVASVLEPILNV